MSEPGATPKLRRTATCNVCGSNRNEYDDGSRWRAGNPSKPVCRSCSLWLDGVEEGATPQPERLSAYELSSMHDWLTRGHPIPPATGLAVVAELSALRSTIAQLEAENERLTRWYEHAETIVEQCEADAARLHDFERQVAADAPKLQAAEAFVKAMLSADEAVEMGRDCPYDEFQRRARIYDEARESLVAALFPDPEHTQPSRRTVDMAGRPVGELATRTLERASDFRCDNCGKTMPEHDSMAHCWPATPDSEETP